MKKASLFLLFIAMSIAAFAQNDNRYETAMKKNIAKLESAKSLMSLEKVANNFERIAAVKTDQWLPDYYAALSLVRMAFMQKDKDQIDPVLDKAEGFIKKTEKLNPDKAEILCLQSMIASARITVDFQTRGMKYGPVSSGLLQQAKQTAPDNPRVYFLMGQNAFYTPAQWGGGKDKAKKLLEKALNKFEAFKPENELAPHWGKERAEYLLKQCNKTD